MKVSKFIRAVCFTLIVSVAGMPMLAAASAYESVSAVHTGDVNAAQVPVLPVLAVGASPAEAQAALDDFYALAEAQGLSKQEADEATAGMPWWIVTGLIAAGGSMAWYLLDVYVWHKKRFSWSGFARAGGCGALGGVVWGVGGGWAGRVAIRYALVAAGAGGVVNLCNNIF